MLKFLATDELVINAVLGLPISLQTYGNVISTQKFLKSKMCEKIDSNNQKIHSSLNFDYLIESFS